MLATGSWSAGSVSLEGFIGCSLDREMAHSFTLVSDHARRDALQYVERAMRVNNQSARLIATQDALLMYVGVLFPRGLLDQTPTVLGLRVFALAAPADFDVIVPLESLAHRLRVAEGLEPAEVQVPAEVQSLSWASVTPPQEGWRRRLGVNAQALKSAAEQGVTEVAKALPDSVGEAIVQKVRAEVWGASIPGHKRIPAGAGFAADALGFLVDKSLSVHTVDNWVRVSSKAGYVLVKFPGAVLDEDD